MLILQALLVVPFVWLIACAVNLFPRWERQALIPWEAFLIRAGLGLGCLAYAIFALGLVGQLNRTAFAALVAVVAAVGMLQSRTRWNTLRRGWNLRPSEEPAPPRSEGFLASPEQKALAALMGLFALLMLIGCATPPAGSDWDGLSYHLADPAIWIRAGRILPLPWEHHSNFPFTVEMLFTLGLAFGAPVFAKAVHLAFGLLTAGLLVTAAMRLFPSGSSAAGEPRAPRLPLLPAALFLAAPLVFWESTVAYVDLGATFFAFLALYALTVALTDSPERDRNAWLTLAGVAMGFAIGCKTTNGIFLLLAGVGGLYAVARSSAKGPLAVALLTRFLLPAVLLAAPWFLKSWLWTGNPVYPFFYGLFGGRDWNAALARTYDLEQAQFGMGRSLSALALLPWNLTFHPEAFSKGIGGFASLGPFALGLLPLLALTRPTPRWAKTWLSLMVGFLVIWVGLTQQIRYLLPLYPFLCLLAAHAMERLLSPNEKRIGRWGQLALGGFLALTFTLSAAKAALHLRTLDALPVALGQVSPSAYVVRKLDIGQAVAYLNTETSPTAKVMLLEETRGYYLRRGYLWGNPGHHTLIPWETFHSPADLTRWLRAHGFTHLLLNTHWMRPGWGSAPWERVVLQGWRSGALPTVFEANGTVVFAVPAQGSETPHRERFFGLPHTPPNDLPSMRTYAAG